MSEKVQNQNHSNDIIKEIEEFVKSRDLKKKEIFKKMEKLTKFVSNIGINYIEVDGKVYSFIVEEFGKFYEWRINIEDENELVTIIGEIYNYGYKSMFDYSLFEKLIEDLPKILKAIRKCAADEEKWIEEKLKKLNQIVSDC